MQKEIRYQGHTARPSDYDAPDGDLDLSLNLIHENGALHSILRPVDTFRILPPGRLLLIHKVHGQENYLIARPDTDTGVSVYWLQKPAPGSQIRNDSDAAYIAHYSSIVDTAIIGNTIAIATETSVSYLLWKDGNYKSLGSRPPFVSISFGMEWDQSRQLGPYADLNISYKKTLGGISIERSKENADAVWGLLLPEIKSRMNAGSFIMPFFVRYAYRLFDGSYAWQSPPVLMLPSALPPLIRCTPPANPVVGTNSVPSSLEINSFYLVYKILQEASLASFHDWDDIVDSIDFFVSTPIYTFDQSSDDIGISIPGRFLKDSAYFDIPSSGDDVESFFAGHYKTIDGNGFVNHIVVPPSGSSQGTYWVLPKNTRFHDDIKNVANFYKVATIRYKSVSAMDDYKRLSLDRTYSFDSLTSRPVLPDDYRSHCSLAPASMTAFNSRLNIAGIKIFPAAPFPLKASLQATTFSSQESKVSVTVYTRINGVICSATNTLDGNSLCWNLDNDSPFYIYYPDAAAFKMVFRWGGKTKIIDLTPHDFLNGAYWYVGRDLSPVPNADPVTTPAATCAAIPNKVYTSEVDNPFFFPLNGINTVGLGSITDISTAAKALSQGQFGQFPLYAFTDDGVWALETTPAGTYRARQPITRDVILPGTKPLQLDSAVLFPTDRGIMLLSGSQTQCISDSVNSHNPFNLLQLPGMATLHSMLGHPADTCLPAAPFLKFIAGCGMLYDYVHQRVIVYNPAYSYAYVYSLNSKQWGMMYSEIEAAVNSYPEALAVDHEGALLDFSSMDDEPSKGLFVTRPLKLDAPDILKTVDTVIQRGLFRKGHVQSVLYGSRDLFNWHLVWSSKDHYLRGFRGTPYKYFRIACVTSLADGESIFGASVQFTPRLTNQPR